MDVIIIMYDFMEDESDEKLLLLVHLFGGESNIMYRERSTEG